MSDKQLRALERLARAGDHEAQNRLVEWKFRLGLLPPIRSRELEIIPPGEWGLLGAPHGISQNVRIMRSDFDAFALQLYTVSGWNAGEYCRCEIIGCETCEKLIAGGTYEPNECCGACFVVICSQCNEDVDNKNSEYLIFFSRWVELYCESCAYHNLTYQEYRSAQYP